MYLPLLLAQQVPPAEGAQANPIMAFLPLILMMFIFYFLLLRPQQKRQRDLDEMINNLKKGDRVVTSGGILATVLAPPNKEGIVVLKIGEDTKIEVLKSSIGQKRSS